MKNQVRTLQSVLFVLLILLGMKAFTVPNDSASFDLTEGKILAAENNYKSSLVPRYHQAQQDFKKMTIDFDSMASATDYNFERAPELSLISQSLYAYDNELKSVNFYTLSLAQRKSFLDNLDSLKKEFYTTIEKQSFSNK